MLIKTLSRTLLLVALALTGLACTGVVGSGTAATDTRGLSGFSDVEVHGVVKLELTLGKPHSVELSGDDNLLPLMATTVDGDRLIIRGTESMRPKLPLIAKVTAPDISLVRGSGATELRIEGVDNDELTLELSGAGQIAAKGTTKKLAIDLSGASKVDADGLSSTSTQVNISGASRVDLAEPEELDVTISGAGTVTYGGSPKITKSISGAGKVVPR